MPLYYVNDNDQPTGEHEVHKDGCSWLAKVVSKTSLGLHTSCHGAIAKAKTIYSNVDGCAYCCPDCHKK
jgi:hypothetical protein